MASRSSSWLLPVSPLTNGQKQSTGQPQHTTNSPAPGPPRRRPQVDPAKNGRGAEPVKRKPIRHEAAGAVAGAQGACRLSRWRGPSPTPNARCKTCASSTMVFYHPKPARLGCRGLAHGRSCSSSRQAGMRRQHRPRRRHGQDRKTQDEPASTSTRRDWT